METENQLKGGLPSTLPMSRHAARKAEVIGGESVLLQESRGRKLVGLFLLPGLEPLAEPGSLRVGTDSSFQAWAEVRRATLPTGGRAQKLP